MKTDEQKTDPYIIFMRTTTTDKQKRPQVWAVGCGLDTHERERGQCPWLDSQVLHVLKILAAFWFKIAAL